MTLLAYMRLVNADSLVEHNSYHVGISPIPSFHPPSLKTPQRVKQDFPTDGWHAKDSPRAKRQAREDLRIIVERLRRQGGKPEITQGALYPVFPNIHQWL